MYISYGFVIKEYLVAGRRLPSGAVYQLTQYKGMDGAVTTYAYDGTEMRTAKTMNGETTRFYWDRGFISNESVNGTITATNYIGAQGIFARQQGGTTDYLFKNGHVDVTAKVRSGAIGL